MVMAVMASATGYAGLLDIAYVGAAGYMLESSSKKVLTDAPFSDFVKKFEVPVVNQVRTPTAFLDKAIGPVNGPR